MHITKSTLYYFPDGVFRESYSSVMASEAVPSIPVQPIGYGDAIYFMRYHRTYLYWCGWKLMPSHIFLQPIGCHCCTQSLDWRTECQLLPYMAVRQQYKVCICIVHLNLSAMYNCTCRVYIH